MVESEFVVVSEMFKGIINSRIPFYLAIPMETVYSEHFPKITAYNKYHSIENSILVSLLSLGISSMIKESV